MGASKEGSQRHKLADSLTTSLLFAHGSPWYGLSTWRPRSMAPDPSLTVPASWSSFPETLHVMHSGKGPPGGAFLRGLLCRQHARTPHALLRAWAHGDPSVFLSPSWPVNGTPVTRQVSA